MVEWLTANGRDMRLLGGMGLFWWMGVVVVVVVLLPDRARPTYPEEGLYGGSQWW